MRCWHMPRWNHCLVRHDGIHGRIWSGWVGIEVSECSSSMECLLRRKRHHSNHSPYSKSWEHCRDAGTHSLPVVTAAVRDAFTEQLIEKQTELVLARYGLNMSDFVRTGPATFGEQVFTSMKYQIDAINLDCVLLVLGFDEDSRAHIFTVEEPGVICNHDLSGFWAIGSGANRALSSLFFRNTVHP